MTHTEKTELRTYRDIKRTLMYMDALCSLTSCRLTQILESKNNILHMYLCASYVKLMDKYPKVLYVKIPNEGYPIHVPPHSIFIALYNDTSVVYISDDKFACYLNADGDVSCIPVSTGT